MATDIVDPISPDPGHPRVWRSLEELLRGLQEPMQSTTVPNKDQSRAPGMPQMGPTLNPARRPGKVANTEAELYAQALMGL